jgi:hypothetical protein
MTRRGSVGAAPTECGMEAVVIADRRPVRCVSKSSQVLLGFALLAALPGCGRPATLAECNEIVTRITQLELKARGGAGQSAEVVKETIDALRKTTMKECVGRRIDDGAMACVRGAGSAQQIVSECF